MTRNRLFSTVLATALGTLLSAVVLSAGAAPLFSIEDPKGDDHGAGGLLYPNREDMHPGDLDLVRLEAERARRAIPEERVKVLAIGATLDVRR